MATRATYCFISDNDLTPNITVYIHTDGYLEGAAFYFWNWFVHPNQYGDAASRFIRANDRAMITRGHDAHGDTDFHYDLINEEVLLAWKNEGTMAAPCFRLVSCGALGPFVNHYLNPACVENFRPLVEVTGWSVQDGKTTRWMPQARVEAALLTVREEIMQARKRGSAPAWIAEQEARLAYLEGVLAGGGGAA